MIKISKRLETVASLVSSGNRLADVGTDHAYIPIWLAEQGRIPSAIAMDINEGPLQRARQNVEKYGYEGQIVLRLSDGLDELEPGEADTILIAGMGGPLMMRILTRGRETSRMARELILQPQSELTRFRHFLHENGYRIQQEKMVLDEGKYYTVIKAALGEETYDHEWAYRFGKCLVEERSGPLREWLLREREKYGRIQDQLTEKGRDCEERRQTVRYYLKDIDEALAAYESR